MASGAQCISGSQRDNRRPHRDPAPGFPMTGTSKGLPDLTGKSDIMRIMVVDDDPGMLETVADMVVQAGYPCTRAMDAMDALFYINKERYLIVMAEYDISFMDGFQLIDQVKRRNPATKIIIMTGQCEAVIRDRILGKVTVDGLLFKPFTLDIMQKEIEAIRSAHFKTPIP